jgi:endonuclease III
MNQIVKTVDDVAAHLFSSRWENQSYPSIILGALPKLVTVIPALMELPNMGRKTAEVALKKAGPFLQMLGMGSANK